jgi:hypothetical protein
MTDIKTTAIIFLNSMCDHSDKADKHFFHASEVWVKQRRYSRSFPSYFHGYQTEKQQKIGTLPTISTKIMYNRPYRQWRLATLTYNARYITS